MDAIFIINLKLKEVILFKEYKDNDNHAKVQSFLLNNLSKEEKSPFILVNNTMVIHMQYGECLMYLCLLSEASLIQSVCRILTNIHHAIERAFETTVTVELIKDNLIQILLMIDQYLLNGVPIFDEPNVLSGLVKPYALTDKITEKIIGKAKEYDTRTLRNFIKETQVNYDSYRYSNENYYSEYGMYFHFNDYLELVMDKSFNQIHRSGHSEVNIISQLISNVELNILFNIPFEISDFSLDESVMTKRKDFIKKKTLDCLVRHGSYNLVEFLPTIQYDIALPFRIDLNSSQTNNNYNLNVQIELVQYKDSYVPIEDAQIKLIFPENFSNSNLSVSLGDFEFNSNTKQATWSFNKLDTKQPNASLKGHLIVDTTRNHYSSSCILQMSCKVERFSVFGGAITKVNITKNADKLTLFKKAKNVTYVKSLEIVF